MVKTGACGALKIFSILWREKLYELVLTCFLGLNDLYMLDNYRYK